MSVMRDIGPGADKALKFCFTITKGLGKHVTLALNSVHGKICQPQVK